MKILKTFIAIMLMSILGFTPIYSQHKSDNLRPKWLTSSLPSPKTSSYIFLDASGSGNTLEEARQNSLVNLSSRLEHERGIIIKSSIKASSNVTRENGIRNNNSSRTFRMECEENGKNIIMTTRCIDEYWEYKNDNYICYVLYTVADNNFQGGSYDDDIYLTTAYGAKGMLYSFIPGVGQLHKGSKTKGLLIMASEIVAIGGIIYTENERASYESKMRSQPKFAKKYKTNVDNFETARNCCIGAAAAIYIYNLIDALVAPGARRVVVKQRHLNIAPMAYQGYTGFSLTYNF